MALYTIGDTHLSLGSSKPMDVFGGAWEGYVDKLAQGLSILQPEDTLVIAGDISWGMSLEEAEADFAWLDALPGTKILRNGREKVRRMPPSTRPTTCPRIGRGAGQAIYAAAGPRPCWQWKSPAATRRASRGQRPRPVPSTQPIDHPRTPEKGDSCPPSRFASGVAREAVV